MNKILASSKIYIGNSKIPNAGRGVFAKHSVKRGEIIEECPFIEIDKADPANILGSHLVTYYFYFGKKKERIALVLGYGSLYNHSSKPNAIYEIKKKEKTLIFTALRNIKKNQEITFNYKGTELETKTKPLWFQ